MLRHFDLPTQVKFTERELGEVHFGIAFGDCIICACCGSVIKFEDYEDGDLIIEKEYEQWVDFEREIGEEE